jgi:hypothetical protein
MIDTTDTPTTTHPLVPQLHGPLARARARQLNYHVSLLLGILIHENMMLSKLNVFMLLRNGPSMDGKAKHWTRNVHEDGRQPTRILDDTTSEEFKTLKPP